MDRRYKPLAPEEMAVARQALNAELAASPSLPIPAVIRKIRTGLRLTIAEYAKICGVSARTLADIEREDTSPTLATAEKLLKPLGMRPGAVAGTTSAPRANGPSLANAQDRSSIDLAVPWQVDYWTRELGITIEELKGVIDAVGPTIGAVRQHLMK